MAVRSFLAPEIRRSNPAIGSQITNQYRLWFDFELMKINRKETGNGPLKKLN